MARSRRPRGIGQVPDERPYQASYLDPDRLRMTHAPQTFATKRNESDHVQAGVGGDNDALMHAYAQAAPRISPLAPTP